MMCRQYCDPCWLCMLYYTSLCGNRVRQRLIIPHTPPSTPPSSTPLHTPHPLHLLYYYSLIIPSHSSDSHKSKREIPNVNLIPYLVSILYLLSEITDKLTMQMQPSQNIVTKVGDFGHFGHILCLMRDFLPE